METFENEIFSDVPKETLNKTETKTILKAKKVKV